MGDFGIKATLRSELAGSGISYNDLEPKYAGHRTLKSHVETMMFLNKISVEELKEGTFFKHLENGGEDIDPDDDDDDYDDYYNKMMMMKKKMMKKKKMKKKKIMKRKDDYAAFPDHAYDNKGKEMAEITMMLKTVMSKRIKMTKEIYKQLGIPWMA